MTRLGSQALVPRKLRLGRLGCLGRLGHQRGQ